MCTCIFTLHKRELQKAGVHKPFDKNVVLSFLTLNCEFLICQIKHLNLFENTEE